jgi:hypothetical protein
MNDEARLMRDLLFLSMAAAIVIGAEVYRWKRGVLPFGRLGTYLWVCSAVWIVLWLATQMTS